MIVLIVVVERYGENVEKCLVIFPLSLWSLLGFDTLTIMQQNFFFQTRRKNLHFCPPLLCCVVRKMTTLMNATTSEKSTTKRKRKRTKKFDDASLLQKPNTTTKRMKMKNDFNAKTTKEETNTNLLGILVEATDCASPLLQTKTTKNDDKSTPPPPLDFDKNDDDENIIIEKKNKLEKIQNSKIEEEDQKEEEKEAKRRSNAPQPDEEEKEKEEETTFTTKTSSIIDDEATKTIESIAKAAPKQGLKMFVQWLDALVFDLKSRAATLKRSKKRAQKAFLRMQKEEKKKYVFLETASAKTKGTKKIKKNIKSTRDLKMLRALEDFWGVELSETEKSLERARATLKAHTLMLTVEKNDEKAILASAVAFYRTSFGLISEHVVKRE